MRILLITSEVPATPAMPGSHRVFSLFRHLARHNELHLATFNACGTREKPLLPGSEHSEIFQTISFLPRPRTTSFWGRQRHRFVLAPYFVTEYRSPAEFRAIERQISDLVQKTEADLVFAGGLSEAQYVLEIKGVPRVVEATDAISMYFRAAAAYAKARREKLSLWLEGLSIRRFEIEVAKRVDAYVVCSTRDQEVLESYDREIRVECIPNGVDAQYFTPGREMLPARTIVFTGVMNYAPNRDAARFLCREILPRVRAVIPEVDVQLVGSNPPDDVCNLAGNGVTVTGTVPDVRPFIRGATVYVSPLRFGSGVKNKVLIALAMGKAVVATPESCEGLDLVPGEHLLVGTSSDDLATHIIALLRDPGRRRRLGVAGRNFVVQRYQWEVMGKQLEALLEGVMVRTRAGKG